MPTPSERVRVLESRIQKWSIAAAKLHRDLCTIHEDLFELLKRDLGLCQVMHCTKWGTPDGRGNLYCPEHRKVAEENGTKKKK